MSIEIIAAVSLNGVIGKDKGIPWREPEDLKRFKRITSGHPIIMGRRTFESIGKPLPDRLNIVLSSWKDYRCTDIIKDMDKETARPFYWAKDFRSATTFGLANDEKVFAIGGTNIYAMALPLAEMLHITHVNTVVEGGDTFLPMKWWDWEPIETEVSGNCTFVTYRRKNARASRTNGELGGRNRPEQPVSGT